MPPAKKAPNRRGVAALLFFSGLCALVYQVVWLRELRLVFGAATPASAAVLAVFMGGLGYGSLWLGKKAEEAPRPLALYANLELGIAVLSALTPVLLWLARQAYIALGGVVTLGLVGGTVARLALASVVLLPPTLLMGGTLPAAARAVTGRDDVARQGTALLYGLNTLGAVTGAAVSTFLLLEVFGARLTLWLACLINALVALTARAMARSMAPTEPASEAAADDGVAPPRFVLLAAACTGLSFLLMELTWYRLLGPLLGGSSYTFGLILAVALLGIGLGGLGYTRRRADQPATLDAFALTCGLEALALAIPLGLGDRLAWLALYLRPLGSIGLAGHALGWTVITAIVVLPAALVAGFQFPLLIALLGRGEREVGRHVGLAYAFNTAGAIVGSLAGGFWLVPLLGAVAVWKLDVWLLVLLGAAALVLHCRGAGVRPSPLPLAAVLVAVALVFVAEGPTALWRHTPIGAGRVDHLVQHTTRNAMRQVRGNQNRATWWERDGRESSLAIHTLSDQAFIVNGKSDGAAMGDADTQIMGGLLGALLHPREIKRALVVGLGTGSTAGWLAALPGIEQVDVVELEPAMVEVARACAPVNHDVLDNPKVKLVVGDAREVLLTTKHDYDLVFSEPSNPYRAGIASLFTSEFYRAVRKTLRPDALLVQWVQAYEIDAQSMRTVLATLSSVFPSVEAWRTSYGDLALVARERDVPFDVARTRARIAEPPFRQALMYTWRVDSVEGVLARFVARPALARAVAQREGELGINTDDRNLLEFSVARSLGRSQGFSAEELQRVAAERGEDRPLLAAPEPIDWPEVYDAMTVMQVSDNSDPALPPHITPSPAMQSRFGALQAWRGDHLKAQLARWGEQAKAPANAVEVMVMADAYAVNGLSGPARELIAALRRRLPIEADAIEAKLLWAEGATREAWQALDKALSAYRAAPWANERLMSRALPLALEVARKHGDLAPRVHELLGHGFAVHMLHDLRLRLLLDVALLLPDRTACVAAVQSFGRWYPWELDLLRQRVSCYQRAGDARAAEAQAELDEYLEDAGADFAADLRPEKPLPPRMPPASR